MKVNKILGMLWVIVAILMVMAFPYTGEAQWGTNSLTWSNIANNVIDSTKVVDASISGADLRADAADSTKIRAASVSGSDLVNPFRYTGNSAWNGTMTVGGTALANAKTVFGIRGIVGAQDTLFSLRSSNDNTVAFVDSSGKGSFATTVSDSSTSGRFLSSLTGGINNAAISPSGDKDTGLYWLTATGNRLGVTTGGVKRAVFDSTGLTINGTDQSATSIPGLQITTNADAYPLFMIHPYTHDNVTFYFDSYWNGSAASSDFGSNFAINKNNDVFSLQYNSGTTVGSAFTPKNGLTISSAGAIGIPGTLTPQALNSPVQVILADSTLTAARSGYTYIARPIAAKVTLTLPENPAIGTNFIALVADADSLRFTTTGSDSLIDNTGAAWKTTSSVAGSVKVILGVAAKWFMIPYVGTWTSY